MPTRMRAAATARIAVTLYFDMVPLIALFGFVGSAAVAEFLRPGEVIES